ncbi:MAG: methyltransferase domain-containing protein, partial [Candidatus Zixiibacteriota bacterium]
DSVQFKENARGRWQEVAGAWQKWLPYINRWYGSATEMMLDLAELEPGHTVLDVAAGSGAQSILAAGRVGPKGSLLAIDIAQNLLRMAKDSANQAGVSNVRTRVMDAENLELDDASFDAVISRLGLMLLPDPDRALAEAHRVLKPGGRYSCIVFSSGANNPYFSITSDIMRRHAAAPPPGPNEPDAFRYAEPGALIDSLKRAGFHSVAAHKVRFTVEFPTLAEGLAFRREVLGVRHSLLKDMSDQRRDEMWFEIQTALEGYSGPGGLSVPGETLVGVGTK